jgi:hypothetical protein
VELQQYFVLVLNFSRISQYVPMGTPIDVAKWHVGKGPNKTKQTNKQSKSG